MPWNFLPHIYQSVESMKHITTFDGKRSNFYHSVTFERRQSSCFQIEHYRPAQRDLYLLRTYFSLKLIHLQNSRHPAENEVQGGGIE